MHITPKKFFFLILPANKETTVVALVSDDCKGWWQSQWPTKPECKSHGMKNPLTWHDGCKKRHDHSQRNHILLPMQCLSWGFCPWEFSSRGALLIMDWRRSALFVNCYTGRNMWLAQLMHIKCLTWHTVRQKQKYEIKGPKNHLCPSSLMKWSDEIHWFIFRKRIGWFFGWSC